MSVHKTKRQKCENEVVPDDSYFKAYADIQIHQEMIGDEVRTNTYRLAIMRNYESLYKKVVADVGAGTGILSMFCVKAGASKVYAIEASDMAVEAEKVISSNGMSSRITVIHGKVEEVELPEKVDVIVSEWMGYFLLYESMLQSVILARDKWLKKDGIMLPNIASLYLAPIDNSSIFTESLSFWDEVKSRYGFEMCSLKPYTLKCLKQSVHIEDVNPSCVMSLPSEICSINLLTIQSEDLKLIKNKFSFDCFGSAEVNGFVGWFKVSFPKETILSTSPYDSPTHWHQSLFYIDDHINTKQSDVISGSITIKPNAENCRFLDIQLVYSCNGSKETEKLYSLADFL